MEKFIIEQVNNNIYLLIFLVMIIERIRVKSFKNIYTAYIYYFMGIFLHELSHFIVSLLTNGKPKCFSIIPQKIENSYIFGSVYSSNFKWYNRFLISLAPLLLLVILYYMDQYFFFYFEDNIYNQLLYILLVIVLIDSSIPSSADFEIAFTGYGYTVWLSLICLLIYLYVEVLR